MAGGGSETTTVEIPAWLQEAAQSGLARGQQAAGIGYVPYSGPDVAALTPLQEAAMFNTGQAASAFGLAPSPMPGAGMPQMQTFANGMRGYSAFPLYNQAVNELQMRDPAQYAKLTAPFSDSGQFGITSMPMGGGASMPMGPLQGSGATRDYGNTAADRIAQGIGAAGSRMGASNLTSRLPGGVNTSNPGSVINRAAAAMAPKQKAPTAANRPAAKSTSTTKSVQDSRSKASSSKRTK